MMVLTKKWSHTYMGFTHKMVHHGGIQRPLQMMFSNLNPVQSCNLTKFNLQLSKNLIRSHQNRRPGYQNLIPVTNLCLLRLNKRVLAEVDRY